MSFQKLTKLELSFHEAGHAYAFAALMKYDTPTEMCVTKDDNGSPYGWCRRKEVLERQVRFATLTPDVRPSWIWQAEIETAIAIAGPLAEFRQRLRSRLNGALFALQYAEFFLHPNTFDTEGDFQKIRDSLAHIEDPDPLATLKRMIDVADQILAANWSKVKRLARLLFERGELGEDELREWFDRHPARFHHHPLQTV